MTFLSAFIARSLQPSLQIRGQNAFPENSSTSIYNNSNLKKSHQGINSDQPTNRFVEKHTLIKPADNVGEEAHFLADEVKPDEANSQIKDLGIAPDETTIGKTFAESQYSNSTVDAGLETNVVDRQTSVELNQNESVDDQSFMASTSDSSALYNQNFVEKRLSSGSLKQEDIKLTENANEKDDIDKFDSSKSSNSEELKLVDQASMIQAPIDKSSNSTFLDNNVIPQPDKRNMSNYSGTKDTRVPMTETNNDPPFVAAYKQSNSASESTQQKIGPPFRKSTSQAEEIPQVRIGHVNVLIDDQASNRNKRITTKVATNAKSSNTFGLRGL